MMGGPGRSRQLLDQETAEAAQPAKYSRPPGRLLRTLLAHGCPGSSVSSSIATWTQVTTPELTGQATDCFLVPLGASSSFGSFFARRIRPRLSNSAASCWLVSDPATLSGTQWIISSAYHLGGFVSAGAAHP